MPRTRNSFNDNWRFARYGAMPDGSIRPEPANLEGARVDDASWRTLRLPHDWGIEGPFRAELSGSTGKLPWAGIGWYRKQFAYDRSWRGRHVFLELDGAMSHSTVFCNGQKAGGWPYGYASFAVDLTPFLSERGPNQLAVRLDNLPDSSRWYPGGGIYRNTWLTVTESLRLERHSVFVTTPRVGAAGSVVNVAARVENRTQKPVRASVTVEIRGDSLRARTMFRVAPAEVEIAAGAAEGVNLTVPVGRLPLWSLESPNLFVAHVSVRVDNREVDSLDTPFGIRDVRFDPARGFLLNGKVVRLNGVCNHHDLGPLGAATNVRALTRQLELLKGMGGNAIRTSHNPPAPELLDLCDRMGFVVFAEAFDCWARGKTENDYHRDFAEWHERDLRAMVRRDRNHPCVVAWSIGNEVQEQWRPGEHALAKRLSEIVRSEDSTRPTTAGCNDENAGFSEFRAGVDLFGYNYKPHLYRRFHERTPEQPLYGSETASCVSSRGVYFFPVSDNKGRGFFNFQVSSYDLYAPSWASKPDIEFAGQDDAPFVAGEFVWTGFDYLGEPTPYDTNRTNLLNYQTDADRAAAERELARLGNHLPSRSSYFGILDLCGFPKDRYYLYQARWRPELPVAHLLPHWSWPDRIGQITPVHVYTSGDEAELFVNNRSFGRKKRGPRDYRLRWDEVVYEPGTLKVVAYKNGREWAKAETRTAGAASAIKLNADRTALIADGDDLAFVTVSVIDASGTLCPDADHRIRFRVEGAGTLAAVDNGDPTRLESFQASDCRLFHGLCLAIVRTQPGKTGTIRVHAEADGLRPATIEVRAAR